MVIVRLKNGEFIMGSMSIRNETTIELDDALTINYYFDEVDAVVVYFSKYCPFTKDYKAIFPNDMVMQVFMEPLDAIVANYEKYLKHFKYSDKSKRKTRIKNTDDIEDMLKNMFEKKRVH